VRQGKRLNCWNTIEIIFVRKVRRSAEDAPATSISVPSWRTQIWPRLMLFNRLMVRNRVDLPEPESPISTKVSPSLISSEQLCGGHLRPALYHLYTRHYLRKSKYDTAVTLSEFYRFIKYIFGTNEHSRVR